MFVSVSPWCDFYKYDPSSGEYHRMTSEGPFAKGTYHVTIEAPYVYIGVHKDGHLFSLTLRAVQVVYQPEALTPEVDSVIAAVLIRRYRE